MKATDAADLEQLPATASCKLLSYYKSITPSYLGWQGQVSKQEWQPDSVEPQQSQCVNHGGKVAALPARYLFSIKTINKCLTIVETKPETNRTWTWEQQTC